MIGGIIVHNSMKSVFVELTRAEPRISRNVDGIHLVFHNRNTSEAHTLTPNEQQTGDLETRFIEKFLL